MLHIRCIYARINILDHKFFSRLGKRTCLSSMCYRPSMVSNASPDQSFSPCHRLEIICSYIRTPTAPAVPLHHFFYAESLNQPSTVDPSTTPFYVYMRLREERKRLPKIYHNRMIEQHQHAVIVNRQARDS